MTICFYISRQNSPSVFGFGDKISEGLQWLNFAQYDIKPFLDGYLQTLLKSCQNSNGNLTRDQIYQQKQRMLKLSKLLVCLDESLRLLQYRMAILKDYMKQKIQISQFKL